MHVTWYGQSCFQILAARQKGEQVSIVIDPFNETFGLKVPNLSADILLITHQHSDHNNKKAVGGEPFLIEGPGEYEIKEVFIQGIPGFHDDCQGAKRGKITVYVIEAEGIRICHLGDLGQKELTSEQLEKIGNIDVLMVPVGGTYTIDARGAAKVISQIEPRIAIPMHYQIPKLKIHPVKSREAGAAKQFNGVKLEGVDKFLKAIGQKSTEPQPKLLIKKKDLPEGEMRIVVLKP
jgi:L-ascorbate metabolism protein UlaG (beta-lactamase superfamily)